MTKNQRDLPDRRECDFGSPPFVEERRITPERRKFNISHVEFAEWEEAVKIYNFMEPQVCAVADI